MTLAELKQRRAKLIKAQRDLHNATIAKRKGEILKRKGEDGATEDQIAQGDVFRAMTDEEKSQFEADTRELSMLGIEISGEEREQSVRMEELRAKFGKDAVDSSACRFKSLGEQVLAVREAALGREDPRLTEMRNETRAALGSNSTIDSDGGYLLEKQFQPGLFQRTYSLGQILPRVRSIPIGPNSNSLVMNAVEDSSQVNESVMGGIIAYWDKEVASMTSVKPKFRQLELKLQNIRALCYATEEMLSDSVALESVINEGVPKAIQLKAEKSMISGTGAGQCLGILNSGALISVAKEGGQAAATIVYENVLNMYSRMHADSLMDAVWFVNQAAFPQLAKMALVIGTGGVPVWMPASGASGSPFSTLFGRPVIPIPYCAAVGTLGDIIFADMGQYLSINKGGVVGVSSIHVQFLTAEVAFRFTYRINGQPLWDAPFTPLINDQTYSPFVGLATRA